MRRVIGEDPAAAVDVGRTSTWAGEHDLDERVVAGGLRLPLGVAKQIRDLLADPAGIPDASSAAARTMGGILSQLSDVEQANVRNHQIGFVFQSFNLLPRTSALENVEMPLIYAGVEKHTRQQRARAFLQRFGLTDRLYHLPSQLSGGQQQRVAIARALVNSPAILLADEPTGNLDSNTESRMFDLLKKLNDQGKTIIYVTHSKDLARRAAKKITILTELATYATMTTITTAC